LTFTTQDKIRSKPIVKRRTLWKAIKKGEKGKITKKTRTSIITNYTRPKGILNLLSTTKSEKQKNRDQSKESPKEMIVLKSVKKKKTKMKIHKN
jgi:hypothetical protein